MNRQELSNIIINQRALIENQAGEILLVELKDMGWDFPGASLQTDSNWRESLEKSLEEQLDVQVMTQQPFFAIDYKNPETGEFVYTSVVKCQVFNDEFRNKSNYKTVQWFKPAIALELNFAAYATKDALEAYLQ